MFDPPADPYGNDHNCRICDTPMVYDDWEKTWYCPKADEHPERKDKTMDDTVSTLRAEWLEAEKDKIEAEISRMMDLRKIYQGMAELLSGDEAENYIRNANLVDRWIDELKVKKDNLSLSVPAAWVIEEGTYPSPIISGGEVLDTNESKGGDDIPF